MRRGLALAILAIVQALVLGFVAALVLTSTAHAQFRFTTPTCRPAELGGPGTAIMTRDEPDVGSCYVGWWCPPAEAGPWEWYGNCTLAQYKTQYVYRAYAAALATGDVAAMWDRFSTSVSVQPRTADEVAAFRGLHQRFVSQAQASKPPDVKPPEPPPVQWVVDAATAADGTRPAFQLVDGVRKSTSTARATSGQPCRPEVAQASSALSNRVFSAFGPNYSPALVALCRRP